MMLAPVYFIGHGSPMNAIETTPYSETLNQLGTQLGLHGSSQPSVKGILIISAHWETSTPKLQGQSAPPTIHDFYGFPDELFAVQYPALTSASLNESILKLNPEIELAQDWGWDHGVWSVLKHLMPIPKVPVAQLSLPKNWSLEQHWKFAESLAALRQQGILIVGSGNIVHNLRQLQFDHPHSAFAWALDFDKKVRTILTQKSFSDFFSEGFIENSDYRKSVPSAEHFLPLLYCASIANAEANAPEKASNLKLLFEEFNMGAISMTSLAWT